MARRPYRKDPQKSDCYNWEASFEVELLETGTHLGRTSTANARKYVEVISQKEGIKAPGIEFFKRGMQCAYGSRLIRLVHDEAGEVSCQVLLHEMAHIIDHARGRGRDDGHGPNFIRIYMGLLVNYGGIDKDLLIRHAYKMGISF